MRGVPVVLSPNGIPIISVESGAPLLTIAQNGMGEPITLVEKNGIPAVIQSAPSPIVPGPLDVLVMEQQGFNNFSRNFGLASDCAVVGLACSYDGNPVISIEHGGEPLTIVAESRYEGVLGLIAVGRGLSVEESALTVTVTGGNCNQGALRINEMQNVTASLSGWTAETTGAGSPISPVTMTGTSGGQVKGVFVNKGADRNHYDYVEGAETVFDGFFMTGTEVVQDFSTSGPWVLGTGWSIVGDKFVHSGSVAGDLTISHPPASGTAGSRANVDITSGTLTLISGTGSGDGYGAGTKGIISTAISTSTGGFTRTTIRATGDCEVSDVSVVKDGYSVAWVFFTTPAQNGKTLRPAMAYRPAWAFAAAEVLGQNYT